MEHQHHLLHHLQQALQSLDPSRRGTRSVSMKRFVDVAVEEEETGSAGSSSNAWSSASSRASSSSRSRLMTSSGVHHPFFIAHAHILQAGLPTSTSPPSISRCNSCCGVSEKGVCDMAVTSSIQGSKPSNYLLLSWILLCNSLANPPCRVPLVTSQSNPAATSTVLDVLFEVKATPCRSHRHLAIE